jgi:AcrR family transcriptional regulator
VTLSFIEHLEEQLRTSPPKQKGLRTRQRLKIATAKILARDGYHAMRVADISARARLAEGSFYVYFRDKTDAALTVLSELLEDFLDLEVRSHSGDRSQFDAIRAANRRWIAVCRANAGLMRCILQLGDEDPRLADLVQKGNQKWYDRVAHTSTVRRGRGGRSDAALFSAYMLGSMMDELVRKLVIYPDPALRELLDRIGASDDDVADAASVIYLHVLNPGTPLPAGLPALAVELADWLELGRRVPARTAARAKGGVRVRRQRTLRST